MRPQMRVVVAARGRHLAADAARERLLPRVRLQMVSKVVATGELLAALTALEVARALVLGHVALPVGLVGELEAAGVANEGLDAAVRPHVRVKEVLAEVGFAAELALKRPRSHTLVLPLMIQQIALRDKLLLADITLERLLTLMLDADVLVDARLVEHLVADGAVSVQGALLVLG